MNSYVTVPEFYTGGHYYDELYPKEQWMHVAGSYDFLDKKYRLFVNGELKESVGYVLSYYSPPHSKQKLDIEYSFVSTILS